MKIKEISFKNNRHRWELEKIKFSDLTLLVGASGVGKTQILESIMKLKNISNGYAYNGVEWDFHFSAENGGNYRWTGKFETIKEIEKQEFNEKEISGNGSLTKIPTLLDEKLYLNNVPVFERKVSNVTYEKNKNVPKISPHKSVLSLFTNEDKIFPLKVSFEKIILLDFEAERKYSFSISELNFFINALTPKDRQHSLFTIPASEINIKSGRNNSSEIESRQLHFIRRLNVPVMFKFLLIWKLNRDIFDEIVVDFKNVFHKVEDIRFELIKEDEVYELQFKERGTDWISRSEMSSGMLKTLVNIAGMKLLEKGYVVLVDEFENSLGVNCIDAVAGDLVNPERNLQYIITSHHPYIINNISMKYWKLVMRKGAKVSTKNAVELIPGKSKHEAFKQLMNLEEFAVGIS